MSHEHEFIQIPFNSDMQFFIQRHASFGITHDVLDNWLKSY